MEAPLIKVGILNSKIDLISAPQRNSLWCWAASMQMILNYYGMRITQEEIVFATYGNDQNGQLPDWPATYPTIHKKLNSIVDNNKGLIWKIEAVFHKQIQDINLLIAELKAQKPVIIMHNTGEGIVHAVVLTDIYYSVDANGINVEKVVVRDPWLSSGAIPRKGRTEYPGIFLKTVDAFWRVRVLKKVK